MNNAINRIVAFIIFYKTNIKVKILEVKSLFIPYVFNIPAVIALYAAAENHYRWKAPSTFRTIALRNERFCCIMWKNVWFKL